MKLKLLCVIVFQMVVLCGWGQSIEEAFETKNPEPAKQEITMPVDKELYSGKTQEEREKEKRDSIAKMDESWRFFLLKKNMEIEQLYCKIQQIDSNKITKEITGEYRNLAEDLKEEMDYKLNQSKWNNNAELDEMLISFNKTYKRVSTKLALWECKSDQQKDSLNKLLILGICFLAIMAFVPIFTQIKSGIMMRKAKKQQEKQAKKQQEEMERQMLLMDDNNIITLKE